MDVKNDRMDLWNANIAVDLEPVSKLRKRMRQRPQNVIDICSGMSGARAVMEDLGYNIGHWLAVENNSRVAAAVPCNVVVHSRQEDVMKHSAELLVAELGLGQTGVLLDQTANSSAQQILEPKEWHQWVEICSAMCATLQRGR